MAIHYGAFILTYCNSQLEKVSIKRNAYSYQGQRSFWSFHTEFNSRQLVQIKVKFYWHEIHEILLNLCAIIIIIMIPQLISINCTDLRIKHSKAALMLTFTSSNGLLFMFFLP